MYDLLSETRLTVTQLARREGVTPATVWRWCTHGTRGVVLQTVFIGGRRHTSDEAFARFVFETTQKADAALGCAPPARESSRSNDASARLAQAGF